MTKNLTEKGNICPNCTYKNDSKELNCIICKTPLSLKIDKSNQSNQTANARILEFSNPKLWKKGKKTGKSTSNNFIFNFPISINDNYRQELKKPWTLFGIGALVIGISLWGNYFLNSQKNSEIKSPKTEPIATATNPRGIFNFGGAPIFAPMVASGINGRIEAAYPDYELRYSKPLNGDFSSSNGIQMLIDSELSFAYNDRPLNDEEYQKAQLRNINLKQIPFALDGVVIYGNKSSKVTKLNVNQIQQIFSGQIQNWSQIDSSLESLPIVPIMVRNEDANLFGLEGSLPSNTVFVANYTLALRQVIQRPGSISFASSSIAGNQQLINLFAIADGDSQNYVNPTVGDELNSKAFKSGEYPLTRRIFLVLREDDTLDQEAALLYKDFLASPQGRENIEKAGLIPILKNN